MTSHPRNIIIHTLSHFTLMKSRKLLLKAGHEALERFNPLTTFVKFSTLRNGVYGKGQILNLYFSLLMPRFKELAQTETFLAFL